MYYVHLVLGKSINILIILITKREASQQNHLDSEQRLRNTGALNQQMAVLDSCGP